MARNTPPVKCYWGTDFVDELVKILETYKDDDRFKDESKYMNRLIDKVNTYRRDNDDGSTNLFFFEGEASELLFILLMVIVCKDGAIKACDEMIDKYGKMIGRCNEMISRYEKITDKYMNMLNGCKKMMKEKDDMLNDCGEMLDRYKKIVDERDVIINKYKSELEKFITVCDD